MYGNYEVISAESSTLIPGTNGLWYNMTGNSITLTPGTWRLSGSVAFFNSGGLCDWVDCIAIYSLSPGGNSPTTPGTIAVDHGNATTRLYIDMGTGTREIMDQPMNPSIITVTEDTTLYLVPYGFVAGTLSNARIVVRPMAERLR